MTILAPRANPLLLGHSAAEALFDEALQAGRMHHAWLITGPPGIGKETLAYRFARRLFTRRSNPNDPASPTFRRVAEATHADLLTVERQWDEKNKRMRAEIVVDVVRAVPDFLHLTPAEGGWRVVVVDGVEAMNRNAANALLKVLEEPPARAVLLLTCAAPGRLLPTIRSRCRLLRLQPLGLADTVSVLTTLLPDMADADRSRVAALSDGSPGRGVELAGQGVEVSALVADLLAAPAVTVTRAHEVADRLLRQDGFTPFMALLQEGISRAVRDAVRGRSDPTQLAQVAQRPLAAWGELWHALGRIQQDTERSHLDKRHAIVSALTLLKAP